MGIFKTKKNKRYNYTPRFYKSEQSPALPLESSKSQNYYQPSWNLALVIVISYLLYFGFRILANFFERKVFPIADKIDDALVVTKERHLKVKEDRDSLNKELEKLRDDNVRHGKDYCKLPLIRTV